MDIFPNAICLEAGSPVLHGNRSTTGKASNRSFLAIKLPLPPLSDQLRLVDLILAVRTKTEEAAWLRSLAIAECDALCWSILFDEAGGPTTPTPMSELLTLREPGVDVDATETYHFAGVYCFGRGVFGGQRKIGMEFPYKRLTRLRAGNFVCPKLMAWEGALAVVPPECDGLVVSTEYPVFEVNEDRALPEVIDVYFRTPAVWPLLSNASTGTNVRRRRLNPADFLAYRMPLPPMATQLRLREVKKRVDAMKRLRAETDAELDAMLPAVLDRAFNGDL